MYISGHVSVVCVWLASSSENKRQVCQRRRKQLGVGGARSRWPIRLRRCAENLELRTVVLIRTCTYTLAPARAIDGHAEIRPSLAPHLARMLEQESVSATLGSQPTLP